MSRNYLESSIFLIVTKIIRIPFALLISILLARKLGPEVFGILNFYHMIILILITFSTLGIKDIIYNDLAKSLRPNKIIINAIAIYLFGALISLAVVITVGELSGIADKLTFYCLSLALVFSLLSPFDIFLEAAGQGKVKSIISSIAFFGSFAIKLFIIFHYENLYLYALAIVSEASIGFILLSWQFKKSDFIFDLSYLCINSIINTLRRAAPLLASSIMIIIYSKIDTFMIYHLMDNTAVGLYVVSIKLSEMVSLVPVMLISAVFPVAIRSKSISKNTYDETIESILLVSYLFLFFACFIITIFSEFIVGTLYGIDYLGSSKSLVILAWAILFQVFGSFTTYWLVNEGLQIYRLYRVFFGLIINIILNYYLIPLYGISGAATATLVSQFIASYIGNALVGRTRKIFYVQSKVLFFINFMKLPMKLKNFFKILKEII